MCVLSTCFYLDAIDDYDVVERLNMPIVIGL